MEKVDNQLSDSFTVRESLVPVPVVTQHSVNPSPITSQSDRLIVQKLKRLSFLRGSRGEKKQAATERSTRDVEMVQFLTPRVGPFVNEILDYIFEFLDSSSKVVLPVAGVCRSWRERIAVGPQWGELCTVVDHHNEVHRRDLYTSVRAGTFLGVDAAWMAFAGAVVLWFVWHVVLLLGTSSTFAITLVSLCMSTLLFTLNAAVSTLIGYGCLMCIRITRPVRWWIRLLHALWWITLILVGVPTGFFSVWVTSLEALSTRVVPNVGCNATSQPSVFRLLPPNLESSDDDILSSSLSQRNIWKTYDEAAYLRFVTPQQWYVNVSTALLGDSAGYVLATLSMNTTGPNHNCSEELMPPVIQILLDGPKNYECRKEEANVSTTPPCFDVTLTPPNLDLLVDDDSVRIRMVSSFFGPDNYTVSMKGMKAQLRIAEPMDACKTVTFEGNNKNDTDHSIPIILLVIRGNCYFQEKVLNAQSSVEGDGRTQLAAVIVMNNRKQDAFQMSAATSDLNVYVPNFMVNLEDGEYLKMLVGTMVTVSSTRKYHLDVGWRPQEFQRTMLSTLAYNVDNDGVDRGYRPTPFGTLRIRQNPPSPVTPMEAREMRGEVVWNLVWMVVGVLCGGVIMYWLACCKVARK
eukprot:PhF_6_TR9709/c0_g1_i1/m.14941